jgi:hypothetical protein
MKFLFWNTHRRDLLSHLSRLAANTGADVILLAENPSAPAVMEAELSAGAGKTFAHVSTPGCMRVNVYSSLATGELSPAVASQRFAIVRLKSSIYGVVLLTVAHLPGKLRYSASTQRRVASDLAEEIRREERKSNTKLSMVMGDLNMNPFDPGLVEADALHGVCSQRVAESLPRIINGKRYPMFFNPSWSLMGDGTGSRPPGTFHRKTNDNDCLFFHVLDQVLIRPGLIPALVPGGLRIVSNDGAESLVTAGDVPRKAGISDHLPILFELAL